MPCVTETVTVLGCSLRSHILPTFLPPHDFHIKQQQNTQQLSFGLICATNCIVDVSVMSGSLLGVDKPKIAHMIIHDAVRCALIGHLPGSSSALSITSDTFLNIAVRVQSLFSDESPTPQEMAMWNSKNRGKCNSPKLCSNNLYEFCLIMAA